MIFFSMLTWTIASQGGPNKMVPANFLWLHFQNNRSSTLFLFFFFLSFLRSVKHTTFAQGEDAGPQFPPGIILASFSNASSKKVLCPESRSNIKLQHKI